MNLIKVGTRGSPLALAQTGFVLNILDNNQMSHAISLIKTTGDIVDDKPLYDVGGKALFAKEIESQLLNEEIDIAVHSLKDLETPRPKGLSIVALLPRADARDILVLRHPIHDAFDDPLQYLGIGATVGTSSPRRMALLKYYRPDLKMIPIRGNVNTRLEKLYDAQGPYDAIMLAKAGLDRLNLTTEDMVVLPHDHFVPSAGQGIIAIEALTSRQDLKDFWATYHDESSDIAYDIERGFIERVTHASCRSAIGVYAEYSGYILHVYAMMAMTDETHFFQKSYEYEATSKDVLEDMVTYFSKRDVHKQFFA